MRNTTAVRAVGGLVGVVGALLLALALMSSTVGGPAPTGDLSPSPEGSAGAERLPFVDVARAREVLPGLSVKGRAPLTGYSREAFGAAWADTNGNGCDTRNDVLRRDLRDTLVEDCVVVSGVLDDPYGARPITFVRGPVSSLDVQVDHVVALANAWQTGAAYWSAPERERFANDRRNLLAVDGRLNMAKGDGDTATWLPPSKRFRCAYVTIQVLTKHRHGLWVTAAEKSAMQRVLDRC